MQHTISITVSPLHLLQPIGEVSAEFRLLDKLSVAGIVGFGQVSILGSRATVFEAGAQVRYYLVGTFIHGLHVGAEVLGIFVSVPTGMVSSATGQGVSLAPFVGYKIAANVGFTFEIQLGPAFTLVGAQAGGQSASQSNITPMLNLNVGWSF